MRRQDKEESLLENVKGDFFKLATPLVCAAIVPAAMKEANDAAQREAHTPTTGSGGGAATETLDRRMLESAFSVAHDLANTPHGASHPQQTGMMLADSMSYHHTQPLGMSSPVRAYDAPVMSSQPR